MEESKALPPPLTRPPRGLIGPTPITQPQPPPFHVYLPKDIGIDPLSGSRSDTYSSFIFYNIPSSQWKIRIHEFYSWLQLQMARPGATLERMLYSFVFKFTGTLFEWCISFGEYRQIEFIRSNSIIIALAGIQNEFIG